MPKLPVITAKRFIRVLVRIGFIKIHGKDSHQFYRHPDGRSVVVPVHGKDIPTGTLLGMLRDIQLSKEDLIDLL